MDARRFIYLGIAVLGISCLGAWAYYAQRMPSTLLQKDATASTAPAGRAANGGNVPAAVDVTRVSRVRMLDDLNSVGTLRSSESVVLRPEVAGRVSQINFRDGQAVKKGQLLVAFDASVNQAEVRQAKAELSIARANLVRNDDLARQNFISRRALDESAANVQVLEAKLALAEAKLAKLELRAPFSGMVGLRNVSVGDYVKDGADLINLEDISSVKVDFRVPEKYADLAKPGQQIEVMVDALPGTAFKARVDAIDPLVDSGGRSALLRGRIDNPQGRLKPGMFARVRLILAERANALVVPEEAIVPQGSQATVWKVLEGNKAVQAPVRLGQRRDGQVEILDGLAAGETVVIAGQIRLKKDGAPVRVMNRAKEGTPAANPDGAAVAGTPPPVARN